MLSTKTSLGIQHHLKHFFASRLVAPDKNPGLWPIGVREMLRGIAGCNKGVTKVIGSLQLCSGQDAGCEAVVHSMHDKFATNKTEAVLSVDA